MGHGIAQELHPLFRHLFVRLFFPVACILLVCPFPLFAQVSPGPLAKAHHNLEGAGNCTQCHANSVSSRAFRCTDCHTEIARELAQHRGLHANFPGSGAPGAACVKCHSDHNGENFQLVHWDPTQHGFDHSKTGYPLTGQHAGIANCRGCHQAKNIPAAARAILKGKDLGHTFMGLDTQCSSCHEDKHQGRFGTDCARCHNVQDWKSATIDEHGFDHSKTPFPLTGMHREVACAKCHTAGADGKPRYTGLGFSTCSSCHADPHHGEFTKPCESCHTTATWRKSSFVSTFDHSKTSFPLLGRHTQVGCVTCHKTVNFNQHFAHGQCADCHQDVHGGQFKQRPDGGKCEGCHTVKDWKPSTFSAADHAKTKYPLTGPHANVQCASCHTPQGRATQYKIKFAQCTDCHKDPHNGQFAGAPYKNRCEQCHKGLTWKSTNFKLAEHNKLRFPLTGGHVAVPCNECHKPRVDSQAAVFHFASLDCTTCHDDVHHGEFASRMTVKAQGKALGCEACHSTREWQDLTRFNHDSTKFSLLGSHRAVECRACHVPPNLEHSLLHVDFARAPQLCSDCHKNPHSTQFGARAMDCAGCHNTNKWKPSLFDHEKTSFSLKGGHQNTPCKSCHTLRKEVDGEMVLFYKPTPKECSACHSDGVPQGKVSSHATGAPAWSPLTILEPTAGAL